MDVGRLWLRLAWERCSRRPRRACAEERGTELILDGGIVVWRFVGTEGHAVRGDRAFAAIGVAFGINWRPRSFLVSAIVNRGCCVIGYRVGASAAGTVTNPNAGASLLPLFSVPALFRRPRGQ